MENQQTINTSSKQQGSIRTLTVRINPPPNPDWECDCCGKSISELEPFGLEWNREAGAFDAEYLWERLRHISPYNEEAERIFTEFHWVGETEEDCLKADEKMIEKYGKEKAEDVSCFMQAARDICKSFECKDCFSLGEKEYYKGRSERFRNEKLK